MREITTTCTCDRCKQRTQVKPKKIGRIYSKGKYPQGWAKIQEHYMCEQCSIEFTTLFTEFMQGGKKK